MVVVDYGFTQYEDPGLKSYNEKVGLNPKTPNQSRRVRYYVK